MSEVKVVSGNVEKAPRIASIIGRLRKGYTFTIGEDIVRGPAEISLDRKTAEAHLHKFDNYDEVLAFLGRPQTPVRKNPRERLEEMIRDNARMNSLMSGQDPDAQPQARAAINTESSAFKGAVRAEVNKLMPELVKQAAEAVMSEVTKPAGETKPAAETATTINPIPAPGRRQ